MASTVVSHVIIFIAVLTIASGLMVAMKNFADETEGAFTSKSDKYNEYMMTSIEIDVVHYDNTTNVTHIYARNTGRTSLDIDQIDVYIDGMRIARNASNRSIVPDTEVVSTGIWDPRELLHIEAESDLDDTIEHEAIIITGNSYRESETFSI
jgi:archaellum component FlaF (FlaF/FlaG flagellin family)